jgi:hypothetical protein
MSNSHPPVPEMPDCHACNNKMYYPPEDKFMCLQKCENGSLYNPAEPIRLYTITSEDKT